MPEPVPNIQALESDGFWDVRPCDGRESYRARANFRYRRNRWLPAVLQEVAQHNDIIEVGCGQGTDTLTICSHMKSGGHFRGFDHSSQSLASARVACSEVGSELAVVPTFARANALSLPLDRCSVGCVYSLGVVHHIDDTEGAVREMRRVLEPNGRCFILVYRSSSPKVMGAHVLRAFQRILDAITGRERIVLRFLERMGWDMPDGTTMVRECFGVPILKSYTKRELKALFRSFRIDQIRAYGFLWLVTATKTPE